MKHFNSKLLITIPLLICATITFAHDFAVANSDGKTIYYNYNTVGTSVSVTYRGTSYNDYYNEYSGEIVIPETVTYYGNTYSVTSIGERAFCYCNGLTSVTIGSSVTSIGERAFYYCSGLTSVTIGSSVTSIGSDAFEDCRGLQKVIVQNIKNWCSIKFGTIDANPLYHADHLYSDENTEITELVIPDGVTSIGSYAFYGCSGLTSMTIPNSVTSIGFCAFLDCSGLKKVIVPDFDIKNWCSFKYDADNENPLYYAHHLYSDENTEITELVIPDGVTSIGNRAFRNCSGLTSVTIPNSMTSIGESAFSGCSGLTSVTIPNSMTSIGESAFSGCSGLTSVTIPNSMTSIGSYAFSGCSGLTSVTIPNSVTSIGSYAFSGCSGLTSVTIPNSVTSIGYRAFCNCSGLTSVTIPNSVTSIGSYAFSGCSNLTSITWNAKNCSAFSSYSSNPFYNISTQITEFIVGDEVKSIPAYMCYKMSKLKSVTIPNSVTNIGSYAFSYCWNLTSVTIPNSVTNIGSYAFLYLYLETPKQS